jgi:hypothetical protein
MKHLFFKTSINGAWSFRKWVGKVFGGGGGGGGGGGKPQQPPPTRLEPPKLGDYQIYSSFSNAEIVDLLCEGPIHGLVNSYGKDVDGKDILQGIYYDNNPIAIGSQSDNDSFELFNEDVSISNKIKEFASTIAQNTSADKGSNFFKNFFTLREGSKDGKIQYFGTNQNISYLSTNKNTILISVTQFGHNYNKKKRNGIGPGLKFLNPITDTVEYELPNFYASSWQNTNNKFKKFIYKENAGEAIFDQEIHWNNNTINDSSSIITIAKSNFQKLLNDKSVNEYEKLIIKNKLTEIEDIRSTSSLYHTIQTSSLKWAESVQMDTAINKKILYIVKISKTFDRKTFKTLGLESGEDPVCIDSNNKLKNFKFYFENLLTGKAIEFYDCIIPEINNNNEYTGRIYGFYAFFITCQTEQKSFQIDKGPSLENALSMITDVIKGIRSVPHIINKSTISTSLIDMLSETGPLRFKFTNNDGSSIPKEIKYNYSNVTCEIKKGSHNQKPLSLFNKVYLDYEYNSKLLGPFRKKGTVRRFREKYLMLKPEAITKPSLTGGAPRLYIDEAGEFEGSLDNKRAAGGSFHAGKSIFDEDAIYSTHVVENEEVDSVFISLQIAELKDTLTKQMDIDGSAKAKSTEPSKLDQYDNYEHPNKRAQIGTELPTLVTIRVETGKIKNENFYNKKNYTYTIYGYIPSPVIIDFGSPVNKSNFDFISSNKPMDSPFVLPKLLTSENPTEVKRYIRIYKVSTETNSVLIRKEVYLSKVTEIINSKFSYPYSVLIGNKIDARSLSSIPSRSYDCRLKNIKVPQNYTIIKNGYDVRYQNSKKEYESKSDKEIIYDGDWNGKFKMGWTDNPAWILYDLLTNKRYGLGQYLDESQINVWELYKIGRYCDAVDDNGFFLGVPDGRGGLEPRFSCNILFNESIKIFDAINVVANLFRGSIFFSNSEINFVDDRPREPIALFTNSNVKDGNFNYISNKKDDIFNIVEVAYLDKNDNFKTKIEFVEDPDDIRNRGPQRTVINTMGVTSKSMARRIGQHAIWQTTKENQGVEFSAGLESLLCRPGDLIVIEDDLKNRKINYGRILDIDINNRQLRLDNPYDENNFNGYIELYTPTGRKTKEELTNLANLRRSRFASFEVNSSFKSSEYSSLIGKYSFSRYEGTKAFYTGQNNNIKTFCYYDEDLNGWVFSTGLAFQKNNIYDKVLSNVTTANIELITGLFKYNRNQQRPQGQELIKGAQLKNKFSFPLEVQSHGGIFDDEINTQGVRQISKYQISGVITNILDGAIVTLHEDNFNLNLLKFVQPGSPYRCPLKNVDNQIYKVISVREEMQNEYKIVATKYDTGKWSLIENDVFIENQEQIFYDKTPNKILQSLPAPHSLYLDTLRETSSNFSITGSFKVNKGNLFYIKLENKAVNFSYEETTSNKSFNITGLNDLGMYELTVQNISQNSQSLNSFPSQIQKFIGYEKTDLSDYDRPFIQNFTII